MPLWFPQSISSEPQNGGPVQQTLALSVKGSFPDSEAKKGVIARFGPSGGEGFGLTAATTTLDGDQLARFDVKLLPLVDLPLVEPA